MKDWKKELIEKWANIEHKRWAKWQKYMHSKCEKKYIFEGGHELIIPKELVDRWERQIATDYKDLSEKEKESDREQVYPYIEDIENLLEQQKKEIIQKVEESPIKKSQFNRQFYLGLECARDAINELIITKQH